jgi:hypothetical protein
MSDSLNCSWCKSQMEYLHGHAACINNACAMFGLNQAECCSGENTQSCVGTQQNEITLSPQRLK